MATFTISIKCRVDVYPNDFCLNFGSSDCAQLCSTFNPSTCTLFSSDCSILDTGCYLRIWDGVWTDAEDYSGVVSGKFSDGVYCYTVANGIITTKSQCS